MILSKILALSLQFLSVISLNTENQFVSPPTFSLQSGSYYTDVKEDYTDGITIAFDDREDGATIYYSTDETKSEYYKYSEPFVIDQKTRIKAYAITSKGKSKTVTATYTLKTDIVPTIESGIYSDSIWLELKHKECDCVKNGETKIYYTMDNSTPKIDGELYDPDKGIVINQSCTLTLMTVPSNNNIVTYKRIKYIINSNSLVEKFQEKYYYNTLSLKEQKIYQRLYSAAEQGKNALLSDMNLTLNDTKNAAEAFFFENPQFLIDYYIIRVPYKYVTEVLFVGNEDYFDKKEKLNKMACNIIKEIQTDELKMIYTIHDTLVQRVEYVMDADDKFNAGGAIIDNRSVCQGYAMAFTYLCQAVGIECITVKGSTEFGGHAWNMVKVDDNWYHIDVCWDDSTLYDYDYFCITEEEINKTHNIKMNVVLPQT